MIKTDIANLDEAVNEVLEIYCTEVTEAVDSISEKAAKQLKKDISRDSPVKTGKQKDSWEVTEPTRKTMRRYRGKTFVVHSEDDYRKVHLLENGHLTRDGVTRTKPIRYVSKNEEKMIQQYQNDVVKAIKAVK